MSQSELLWLNPDWPAPSSVVALSTLRCSGGISLSPYDDFNLGDHVGDSASAVAVNRTRLASALALDSGRFHWLNQVHGSRVVEVGKRPLLASAPEADASWTCLSHQVCLIMTADCLPVLVCDDQGSWVAAAHAGWRGLVAGILEATCAAYPGTGQLMAWLGPCISVNAFEVGGEVREQFLARDPELKHCFRQSPRPQKWYLDLFAAARQRLASVGVTRVFGGDVCTFGEPDRFYSYRRDGVTGRMASLIYLK